MLTYTQLENHAQYMIEGTTTLPNDITLAQVINYAGHLFFSSHQWNFRERDPITVDLVKDQQYVNLPLDFGELTGIEMTEALNYGVTVVTPQQLVTRRATSITVTQQYYWVAIFQPGQPGRTSDFPPPRLEIWPTPAADNINAITLIYRAKWRDFADTGAGTSVDTANVPDYAEMALIEVVRAVTAGWGERQLQPQGGVTGTMKLVLEGAIWAACVTTDGMQQMTYGPLSGGAIQGRYPLTSWFTAATLSANPQ